MPAKRESEAIEISLLLEGIYQQYGYDFRDYAPASFKRRIMKCLHDEHLATVSALQDKVLHQPAFMQRLLNVISIDVSSMFRDPTCLRAIRTKVVPLLRPLSFIRIWSAGCATGEEVYSLAIILQEERLYEKARLYATDLNQPLLDRAKEGIFPLKAMKDYSEKYIQAGGQESFSDYYTAKYDHARFDPALRKNVVWAQHNLVTDASFNEFHLILCRNVLIYFNKPLQDRVHNLLYESLAPDGILGLGIKETIQFTKHESDYKPLDEKDKLYKKCR